MLREESSKRKVANKNLYRITLFTLKIIPYVIALCYFLNTLLSYYNIENDALSHIASLSLFPFIFIYLSSFTFKFCKYHRLPLYYVLINNGITMIDYYIGISVEDLTILVGQLIITGIFLSIYIYLKLKCRH